jgi:hypothetical protein
MPLVPTSGGKAPANDGGAMGGNTDDDGVGHPSPTVVSHHDDAGRHPGPSAVVGASPATPSEAAAMAASDGLRNLIARLRSMIVLSGFRRGAPWRR